MKLRRLFDRGDPGSGAAAPDGEDVEPDEAGEAIEDVESSEPEPDETDEVVAEADAPEDTDTEDVEHAADDAGPDEAVAEGEDAEAEDAEVEGGPDGDDDEDDQDGTIAFELADWGARERKMLDEQLGALRVPRAWEASTLVVGAQDADVVDDLIDEIEERLALDLSPDVEPVTYDVGDWPSGLEDRFVEALIEARVPHQRGYREVTVGVDDEEQVDVLVEEITKAWEDEQPTEDELDGPDAQEVLSELFVSADRLLHDPSDRPGTVRFDDAAGSLEAMSLPFGFAPADWEAVTSRVATLRDLLSEAGSTDEEIVEAATALRTDLRPLV